MSTSGQRQVTGKYSKTSSKSGSSLRPPASGSAARRRRENARVGGVSDRERYEMIAQMAYFRAAERSFCPGAELEDWLAAESEVDQRLSGG